MADREEPEFVDGLFVYPPHEKAPDFVKATIKIKVADLGVWLRAKHKAGEEWVTLDVKSSKGGKWYSSVSTYKPKEKEAAKPEPAQKPSGHFDDLKDDLPW